MFLKYRALRESPLFGVASYWYFFSRAVQPKFVGKPKVDAARSESLTRVLCYISCMICNRIVFKKSPQQKFLPFAKNPQTAYPFCPRLFHGVRMKSAQAGSAGAG